MPRTELDLVLHWQPFALDRRTINRRAMSGEWADRLRLEIRGALDDVPTRHAPPAARRQHHIVKDRRCTGDAARISQLVAIEVSHPHTHGDVARVSDGPIVVI